MGDRPLHIGVDARELLGKPTGVGRYLSNVLREWQATGAGGHRLTLFAASTPPDQVERAHPGLTWVVDQDPVGGTRWEQTRLAGLVRRAEVDVFFAVGYTAPIRLSCPFVVVIHDVSFFAHPEWFPRVGGLRRRWITKRSAHRAAAVVTVSEFSASEIVRWLGLSRDRIVLAPQGAPEPRDARSPATRPPHVLFVGSLFTRRRIPDLMRGFALALARVPEARLILVGDNRTQPPIDPVALAAELGIQNHMEWREYVDDGELDRLYESARVFAFLSEYEGFGMTPMEAIAGGAPAVLLDTSVAREVYGDGATLISGDPGTIADALTLLLTDDAAHDALLTRGRRRLQAFSWVRTADTIRRTLERAARQ